MSSPEQHSPRPPELKTESKERVKEVARIFIFQARSADSLRDDEPLADLMLVNSLWALKGGEASAGQLTPVGGTIDEGESPEKAAQRELVEETHLRAPERTIEKIGEQSYSFRHRGKNVTMNRRVHYFKGGISPAGFDIPYVLDPAEDKIEEFVALSPRETRTLFEHGEITHAGRVLKILDCLSPNPADRAHAETEINDAERQQVARTMLKHHLLTEARRKIITLNALGRGLLAKDPSGYTPPRTIPIVGAINYEQWPNYDPTDPRTAPARFQVELKNVYTTLTAHNFDDDREAADMLQRVDTLWREHIQHFTMADVKRALEISSIGGKLFNSFHYEKVSDTPRKFRPTFNLETGTGVPTANLVFALLADNLDYSKMRVLARANPQTHRLLKMMQHLQAHDIGQTEDYFLEQLRAARMRHKGYTDLPVIELGDHVNIREMCLNINSYFERLQGEAHVPTDVPIDQLDEIKRANSMRELVALAKGEHIMQRADIPFSSPRILQWEAKRKLILLVLLNDALRVRNEFIRRGVVPIEELEKTLSIPGLEIRPRSAAKDTMSLLRKIIVLDRTIGLNNNFADVAKDIFGAAYVFHEATPPDLIEQNYEIPFDPTTEGQYRVRDADGQWLTHIRAPAVIARCMFQVLEHGQGSVEIMNYQPLPRPGEGVKSKGPGGGGKIRYAKFTVLHYAEDGTVRYKEIQCFVPDPTHDRTAEDEYMHKKNDDRRYGRARLFGTKGMRSFMELLYPASIYGHSVRAIFAGQHKQPV